MSPNLLQVVPFFLSCHRCCFSSCFEGELPIGLAKGAGFAGFSLFPLAMPVIGVQSTAPPSSWGGSQLSSGSVVGFVLSSSDITFHKASNPSVPEILAWNQWENTSGLFCFYTLSAEAALPCRI